MVMTLERLRELRPAIETLAARHGARNLRVFGSVARGNAGPESDVDVLVRFERGRSLLDLIGLQQDLEELLLYKVDVVSEGGLRPELDQRILREAILL